MARNSIRFGATRVHRGAWWLPGSLTDAYAYYHCRVLTSLDDAAARAAHWPRRGRRRPRSSLFGAHNLAHAGGELMKYTVEFKDWTPDAQVREFLEMQIGHLQRLSKTMPHDRELVEGPKRALRVLPLPRPLRRREVVDEP